MKDQFAKISKKAPPHLVFPIKNLIMLNDMRDKQGRIQLAFGNCDIEVLGERHVIGNSLKTKVTGLGLW
jgi:hypothetical protein